MTTRHEFYIEQTARKIAQDTIDAALAALGEGQDEKAALVLRLGKSKVRNVQRGRKRS